MIPAAEHSWHVIFPCTTSTGSPLHRPQPAVRARLGPASADLTSRIPPTRFSKVLWRMGSFPAGRRPVDVWVGNWCVGPQPVGDYEARKRTLLPLAGISGRAAKKNELKAAPALDFICLAGATDPPRLCSRPKTSPSDRRPVSLTSQFSCFRVSLREDPQVKQYL